MSLVFSLAAHRDVQTVIVTDDTGRLVEAMGEGDTDKAAAGIGGLVSALREIGQSLHLGRLERVVCPDRSWYMAMKDTRVVILYTKPGRSREVAEGLLAQIPWNSEAVAPALLEVQEEEQAKSDRSDGRRFLPTPIASKVVSAPLPAAGGVPSSVEYNAVRPGLLAARNDRVALKRLIANRTPEAVARWVEAAAAELGLKLEQLQSDEAKPLGDLIGSLLELSAPKSASAKPHRDWLGHMLNAVAAFQSGDFVGALVHLGRAKPDDRCELLAWPSAILTSRAALVTGALEPAESNAKAAVTLSAKLSRVEECVSLLQLGEVALEQNDTTLLSQCITNAKRLATEAAATERLAQAWLLDARALARSGNAAESYQAARCAQETCPTYAPAFLFQARRAVAQVKRWEAESQLSELSKLQLPRVLQREMRLLTDVQNGVVPGLVGVEFLRLDDLVPSDQVLSQMQALLQPDMVAPCVFLAWKLANLGKLEEAAALFDALAERELPTEVGSDVARGRQCVAEARQRQLGQDDSAASRWQAEQNSGSIEPDETTQNDLVLPLKDDEPRDLADEFLLKETSLRRAAAFTGDIELLAFPDLLEYLRNTRRTGRLVIRYEEKVGTVLLRDGNIVGATSPGKGRIGESLLRQGAITKGHLATALEKQKELSRPLGSVLVELKLVDSRTVQEALRSLVMSAVRELLEWGHGQFQFDAHNEVESEIVMDVRDVLMDLLGGGESDKGGADVELVEP